MAENHLPLTIVESDSFNKIFTIAAPDFHVPGRLKMRDRILEESAKVVSLIREVTSKADYPSYCADLWKSKARVCSFLFNVVTFSCTDL
jgi:hypothetical protein